MIEQKAGEPVRRIVIWRHTLFNTQAHLTGDAAKEVVEKGLRRDDYDDWPLLPEGIPQANLLRKELADLAIDACLCSPPKRTTQTAEIILEGRGIKIEHDNALRERDRGIFAYMPDEWAKNHPLYRIGKESFRNWRPGGETAVPRAQTINEVIDQIEPVLDRADALAPGGCVAISTHGETMAAFRGLYRLGARTDQRYAMPIVPDCQDLAPLKKASWVGQVQIDEYERRNPAPEMTHFKTRGYHKGQRFETDWLEIVRD